MFGRGADLFFNKLYGLEQRLFDWWLGVTTTGRSLTGSDVYSVGGNNWPYEGCHWPAVPFVLRRLRPGGQDVFVDLGSGKGKALLIAARLPYRRVVGVEIDSELAAAAQRNLARNRLRSRAGHVGMETVNALSWAVPDDATTIFMYNPFFGETFHVVLEKVFDSYDRNPRDLHVVYEYPWEHDWLVGTGRVVVENVRPNAWPPRPRWWQGEGVIITYHVTGNSQRSSAMACPHRTRNSESRAMRRWRVPNGHPFNDGGTRGAIGHHDANEAAAWHGPITGVVGRQSSPRG